MNWWKSANGKVLEEMGKYLAFILRHDPQSIGLNLTEGGWGNIDEIVSKSQKLSREMIEEIVKTDKKKRYSISADGQYVRANYGHSFSVDLELEPAIPPGVLYHGTADRFINSIMSGGLSPQSRQFVHLSPDRSTAETVGSRHGRPVILEINSGAMHGAGYEFFNPVPGTWLVKEVPVGFINFPEKENSLISQ
tara:strand:- start:120 stop:698 length:579 start_codon:yes stop_codon:yes gene_type:complete